MTRKELRENIERIDKAVNEDKYVKTRFNVELVTNEGSPFVELTEKLSINILDFNVINERYLSVHVSSRVEYSFADIISKLKDLAFKVSLFNVYGELIDVVWFKGLSFTGVENQLLTYSDEPSQIELIFDPFDCNE